MNLFGGLLGALLLPPKEGDRRHGGKPARRTQTFEPLSDDDLLLVTDRTNPRCPFYHCVGQDSVIEQLLAVMVERLRTERHVPATGGGTFMFTGPASTGKTMFASLMFGKLGLDLPFIQTDGKKIKGADTILSLILGAPQEAGMMMKTQGTDAGRAKYVCPPLGLLIDEIHGLAASVMDNLLKAFESRDCQLITESAIVDCRNVTWVGATTQHGDIVRKNQAFDSRFEKIEFNSYAMSEVTEIMRLNFGWPQAACESLAVRGGGIVRVALDIGKKVGRQLQLMRLRNSTANLMDAISRVGKQMGVDNYGMSDKQLSVLQALARHAPKGMSYPQLARIISRSVRELQEVVLPALQLETSDHLPLVSWNGFTHITEAGTIELARRGLLTPEKFKEFART